MALDMASSSSHPLYHEPGLQVLEAPVEAEMQLSGVLDQAIGLFSERHNIDLSESAARFSLCFRMAAQGGELEVLDYLMQVTPLLSRGFRYVKKSGTGGRIKGRLKLNRDFLLGEFEKRTGQHLDHPEMKEMGNAMKSLARINSGKLLKIIDKYYVVHEADNDHEVDTPESSHSYQCHRAPRISEDEPTDDTEAQAVQLALLRPVEDVPVDPTLHLAAPADLTLPGRASFSEFSSDDGAYLHGGTTAEHSDPSELLPVPEGGARRKALSYDGGSHLESPESLSATKTHSVHARGLSHIKEAGYPTSPVAAGGSMSPRVRRITDFINKSIDSVFSNFLVWHAAIIAACSGDAKSVKRMLFFESRLDSFLTKVTIRKVAKAGFTEISRTLYKLRTFLHSTMSDILIKLVAESGHDQMVFELVRGSGRITPTVSIVPAVSIGAVESAVDSRVATSTTTVGSAPDLLDLHPPLQADVEPAIKVPSLATQQNHITTSVTATATRHGVKVMTATAGRTMADIGHFSVHSGTTGLGEPGNQVALTKGISRRISSVFPHAQNWRKPPQPRKGGQVGDVHEPPSQWRKFHMWEFGLWEFQLVVPVLLMQVESDSTLKTQLRVSTGRMLSHGSLPVDTHLVESELKKKGRYPHRTISDYATSGLYSSGSEIEASILASPTIEEISSLVRTSSVSISIPALVEDIYPSSRSADSKQPAALTKQLHSALKKKMPGFLSMILPSKGFHRYSELKPVARQSACLHVQLKTSANEVQGTGGGGKKFLEMAVAIDNVRCRVENSVWDMKKRNYKMGHFPTMIEIALTPVSCSMEDVSISLTRSSNNPQFEVTLNDSLTGGGGLNISGMSPGADLSVSACKSTTSAVTSTPWRFEQFEAGSLGGGFSWTLHSLEGRPFDRLHPQCEIYSKYNPKKPFFHHPFTKLSPPVNPMIDSPFNVSDGGIIFAGTDYPNAILWRFREQMRGALVTWEIKGRVHTTFVSGKGFWETRVEEFREVFQQDLQVTSQ